MRVVVYSARSYDRSSLEAANAGRHELVFLEARLTPETAALARDAGAVCLFCNDKADAEAIATLSALGVRLIATRTAGFNHIDLSAAAAAGITVARVPAYSPYAVAEHAVALILTLNRKLHRAYSRVREGNFALDGLLGFDLKGKTVGIIGAGTIGLVFARIMAGFGVELLAYDPQPSPKLEALGGRSVELPELFARAQILSLHCPLVAATRHLIDAAAVDAMRPGVMLINTGRGALIDTKAAIAGLKSGKIGALGLDVYEEEESLFFADHSGEIIQDDVFSRLLTFPNVVVTAHQGFFTEEALGNIAATTIGNISAFESGAGALHKVEA